MSNIRIYGKFADLAKKQVTGLARDPERTNPYLRGQDHWKE